VKDGTSTHALALDAEVRSVTFTPSGVELITREIGGRMRVWDVRTGNPIRTWSVKTAGTIVSDTFVTDGRTLRVLAHGGDGVSFQDWDWTDGRLVREKLLDPQNQALADYPPALAPGGRFLAYFAEGAGNAPSALELRDTISDRRKLLLTPDRDRRWAARLPVFSPDGRYLVTSGPDGLVALFRLAERGHLPALSDLEIAPAPREQQ
jgi:WD40 repeat protein